MGKKKGIHTARIVSRGAQLKKDHVEETTAIFVHCAHAHLA